MNPVTINFLGIETEVDYDEDGNIISAKVGDCEIFYELLTDYYVERLEECFVNHMENDRL